MHPNVNLVNLILNLVHNVMFKNSCKKYWLQKAYLHVNACLATIQMVWVTVLKATATLTDIVQPVSKNYVQVALSPQTEFCNFRNTFVCAWMVFLKTQEGNVKDAEVDVQSAIVQEIVRVV